MSITITPLAFNRQSADQNVYVTAETISPAANKLLVVTTYSTAATGPIEALSVTGVVASWSLAAFYDHTNTARRLSVFVADSGNTPTASQLTISFANSQVQQECAYAVYEISGAVRTNNGLDGIVQSAGGQTGPNATTFQTTFASPWAASGNVGLGTFTVGSQRTLEAIPPLNLVSRLSGINPNNGFGAVYGRDGDALTLGMQFTGTAANWTGLSVEIAAEVAAVVVTPTNLPRVRTRGFNGRLN